MTLSHRIPIILGVLVGIALLVAIVLMLDQAIHTLISAA